MNHELINIYVADLICSEAINNNEPNLLIDGKILERRIIKETFKCIKSFREWMRAKN